LAVLAKKIETSASRGRAAPGSEARIALASTPR